ncbi:hypothetical protein F2Q69_00051283 [Brassica cretica]|uniref:Uncharacterized protein n=1 Tax=Brassica cretica TaxID=69181 RepID=A0A8S9PUY3_BRACR|nr:hypothetical protein F2Q69_00051283 [Brassica cretica]
MDFLPNAPASLLINRSLTSAPGSGRRVSARTGAGGIFFPSSRLPLCSFVVSLSLCFVYGSGEAFLPSLDLCSRGFLEDVFCFGPGCSHVCGSFSGSNVQGYSLSGGCSDRLSVLRQCFWRICMRFFLLCHEVTRFQLLGGIVLRACSSSDKSWCRRWRLPRGGLWTAAAAISDLWPL